MDCLGLAGEKPMIPAPPKVWPEVVGLDELVPEVVLLVLPLDDDVVLPVLPLVVLVPPVELVSPGEDAEVELSVVVDVLLPLLVRLRKLVVELLVLEVDPPLGPMPAMVVPASGWPKKPIAVGVLFWPYRTGFQSSLPVTGSMYFLRRKRISLVFTSASALGG